MSDIGRGKTKTEVSAQLLRYIDNVVQDGLDDRAFLKCEAFRFVDRSCQDPETGDDVQEWLWSQVEYST